MPDVPAAVDDLELVGALRRGDANASRDLHGVYADRLFDYCRSRLGDDEAAAEALTRTLATVHAHISLLSEPERLRAWLYALARAESGAGAPPAEVSDSRPMGRLVAEALGALEPDEREALDLSLRHGLPPEEVAYVLGREDVSTLLAEARRRMERWMAAVVLARDGRSPCPEIAPLVTAWVRGADRASRERLNGHVRHCPICAQAPRAGTSAGELLALLPILPAPAASAPPKPVQEPIDIPDSEFWTPDGDASNPESRVRGWVVAIGAAAALTVASGVMYALVQAGEPTGTLAPIARADSATAAPRPSPSPSPAAPPDVSPAVSPGEDGTEPARPSGFPPVRVPPPGGALDTPRPTVPVPRTTGRATPKPTPKATPRPTARPSTPPTLPFPPRPPVPR
ncbi:RNA polymerase sigma factor [Bailinhaonella thermotolerans]|uniref:Sigma-70 family RNA polymerase sigma factor n=1 Tax=Bailinhaonella thermotolerans TaxID=1070861 RepID=A0A3A4ADL4_9ACTN|nr:sigma-70 family RNA polymerase sigma factor [Bailinhaonella thermotolerans]RJL26511.1 sigma-70 family RNA polymerase sigma factor [Bailinhaonella thermotolerans]